MPTFYVSQTNSYTLAVSTETGKIKLELADDLRDSLKELLESAETSAEATAGLFDVLGKDAAHLADTLDAILNMDGALSAAHGAGAIEAMDAMLAEHASNNSYASDLAGRLAEKEGFGGFGSSFVEVPSTDINDYLDWGMSSAGDPYGEEGSEEGKAAIEAAVGQGGLMQDSGGDDDLGFAGRVFVSLGAVAGGVAGWYVGAAVGTGAVGPLGTPSGAVAGAGVGVVAGGAAAYFLLTGSKDGIEEAKDAGSEVGSSFLDGATFIPDDPNAEYADMVDVIIPPWLEEQITNAPTYGQTLVDPNSEKGVEGTKEYNPEEELAREILVDPENVRDAVNAEQVQEAAEFGIVSTTMPAEPEFHFKPEITGKPPVNGGEDFSETEVVGDGSLMATATEYIIPLVTGEEQGLQLASDTMAFAGNLEAGVVESEGTSGAMLEGQSPEIEAGVSFPGEML